MESNLAGIPITRQQLDEFSERANRLLTSVKWAPKGNFFEGEKPKTVTPVWRDSSVADARTEELSLLKSGHQISRDPVLLSQDINFVLNAFRDALTVGMHLSKTYTKFSGLDQLILTNSKGGLAEGQKTEFRSKYNTASAVTLFCTAAYMVWKLSGYKAEEVSSLQVDFPGIPEMTLQDPVRAIDCAVYYYAAYLEKSGTVRTDIDFVKMSLLYFRSLAEELKLRAASLQHAESFTGQSYKLENTDFSINGFEFDYDGSEISVEFNRVELDEIVGNRDAKHDARRTAGRLLCYDPLTKRNPMQDLGGLAPVTMGYGEPGTGKSLLIAALATMLHDYCKNLGIPFLFWPMPDTVVSTYQGGSAERMMSWMKVLKDPTKIIYAPIDDAENNLEERTRQGVSAGVREVIAVFLRNTEGAYAVHHGNAVIQLFTNLPDQIDKAVMSRINNRSYIGGAKTKEDFLDQDFLWMKKHHKVDPGFVRMTDPKGYNYLESQALLKTLSTVYEKLTSPTEEKIRAIFEQVMKRHQPDEHEFFAEFFLKVKEQYPFFTSRDIRNIQRAIDSRIMDFDMPEEWMNNPEVFFKKDYDSKRSMIVELMKSAMKGLSFAEVRLQETIRYLDNMVRIADTGRNRKIQELVDDYDLRHEAQQRIEKR